MASAVPSANGAGEGAVSEPIAHAPHEERFEGDASCVSMTTGAALALALGVGIVTRVVSAGATDGAPSRAGVASIGAHWVSSLASQVKCAHFTRYDAS